MFRGICDYRRHSITHGTQSLPSGQEKGARGLILFSFDQDKITHSSHLRRQSAAEDFALSTAMTVSATAAASVWVFWVGFTCLLARHEPTTTAPPLSIPIAEHHTHTLVFPQNFSRIETELCAKEIIAIPLVVTE